MTEAGKLYDPSRLIVVRGGGDIATGTIWKLRRCGFPVLVLETQRPTAIRRNVAFCEAVSQGSQTIEGMTCRLARDIPEAEAMLSGCGLAMLIDPEAACLSHFHPLALVDAILAKKNLGTNRSMCPITVALGPGFVAGVDVDAVIETNRGHRLGRVILDGPAEADTGVPGMIKGYGRERVLHSPATGTLRQLSHITDTVTQGQVIAEIQTPDGVVPVTATLSGLLRGLIADGFPVWKGLKIADIDPRTDEYQNCFTISDKARCIAGGVLEAILYLHSRSEQS